MAATTHSTSLIPIQPAFNESELLALAGFLAGYRGLTREAHARPAPVHWLGPSPLAAAVLGPPRRHETFARELEARGRARATVTRRLCTIASFYKYAVEDELLDHSRPRTSAVPGWTTSRTPRSTGCGYRRPPARTSSTWSTPGSRSATSRKPPRTPTRAPPCATTAPGPAWTGTPPTSSPPTSPGQPDSPRSRSGRLRRPDRQCPEALLTRLPSEASDNDHEPMLLCLSRCSSWSFWGLVVPGFAERRTRQGWAAPGVGGQALIRSRVQRGGGRSRGGRQIGSKPATGAAADMRARLPREAAV